MKKFVASCLFFSVLVIFGVQPFTASAEARAGAKCAKAGKVIAVAATKFVCAKSGKKLVWTIVSVATTTTTTTTTVVADKRAPIVTLLRGAGSSTTSTLTFTVTGDEPITCSTLSRNFDEDFTWDKISIIGSIVQTSTTVCTITAWSTAERDNDDHLSTLRASTNFSITDTAGNAQRTLLGSPQSTTVKRT